MAQYRSQPALLVARDGQDSSAGVWAIANATDEASLAALYRRRAAELALPAAGASPRIKQARFVLFQLGDETYGISIHLLERVFAKPMRTQVPGAGARWAGVFPVQGEIVPILHLAHILSLPEPRPDSGESVLTLRVTGRRLGLLVGKVLEIREISAESVRPPGAQARYVKGVSAGNALILDMDSLVEQES